MYVPQPFCFLWIASSCASVSSPGMASSSDSPELSVGQLIRNWSTPSRVASTEEGRVCDQLTEVLKHHMKLETGQLVADGCPWGSHPV